MLPPFDPAEFAMLMENGYFGVSDNKIDEIVDSLFIAGVSRLNKDDLFDAAWDNGIDPDNLSLDDIREIRHRLEERNDDDPEEDE